MQNVINIYIFQLQTKLQRLFNNQQRNSEVDQAHAPKNFVENIQPANIEFQVLQEEQPQVIKETEFQPNQENKIKQPVQEKDQALVQKDKCVKRLFENSHGLEDFVLLDKIGSVS